MGKRNIAAIAAVVLIGAVQAASAIDTKTPAKVLFGAVAEPAAMPTRSIGFYSRGCLAGAEALPIDGPDWQVMRLSRNRFWGMPELVTFIEALARDAHQLDGWRGLLIGDMSQPRGGPMISGHASHQIGLDVDIWLTPEPDHTLSADEREKIAATSLIKPGTHTELDTAKWNDTIARLIRRAASYDGVERIFVNAGIKKALCEGAGKDRAWLRKVRPWYQHDDHFHVRLACPPGMAGCKEQDATPQGDGCGSDLSWWLSPAPYLPPPKPKVPPKPRPQITLADLPTACAEVLAAPGEASGSAVAAKAAPAASASKASVPLPLARPSGK